MANVASRGYTFGATELVTNAKLHALVDSATITIDTLEAGVVPVKATGAELNTGTDDSKFATAKALTDSDYAKTSDIPVKATGAEIDTGTDDAKFVTAKAIADSSITSGGTYKVGSFTRAMDAASGDVAYTGVGFTPKAIHFFGTVDGSTTGLISGSDDGTTRAAVFNQSADGAGKLGYSTDAIRLYEAAGKLQTAVVKTFDADGFTLTWTRTGSTASATAYMFYIAYA